MRKKHLFAALLFQVALFAQSEYNSTDYKSFEKANSIFSKLEQLNYSKIDSISYQLDGTWYYLGHYSLPRQHQDIPYSIDLDVAKNNYSKAISKYISDGKTYTQVECYSSDTAYIIPFNGDSAKQGELLRKQSNLPFYSPISVYWDMKTNRATMRYIGEDEESITLSYMSSFLKQASVINPTLIHSYFVSLVYGKGRFQKS